MKDRSLPPGKAVGRGTGQEVLVRMYLLDFFFKGLKKHMVKCPRLLILDGRNADRGVH